MSRIVVFLAEGFEEIEAIVPVDILRRGGVEVTIAGIGGEVITGAHGVRIFTDTVLDSVDQFADYDGCMLPGGLPGATNLANCWEVNELIINMFNDNRLVSAICASPAVVLAKLGILDNRQAVCYPGAESFAPECDFGDQPVLTDGNLITGRGPGYASDFGLAVLKALEGEEAAEDVGTATLFLS